MVERLKSLLMICAITTRMALCFDLISSQIWEHAERSNKKTVNRAQKALERKSHLHYCKKYFINNLHDMLMLHTLISKALLTKVCITKHIRFSK